MRFAVRLSLGPRVALDHAYECWDGKGMPYGLHGEAIALASRFLING